MATTSAESYLAEANKALNRATFFGIGKQQKFTDAAEIVHESRKCFQIIESMAVSAFLQTADALMQAGDNKKTKPLKR
jgi:hypothetical protein